MSTGTHGTYDYPVNNKTMRVMFEDITKIDAEALVSSDDNHLSMGGGVSCAILNAGGEQIRQEVVKHIPLKIGEVAVTSAGQLPAKYIFHAVTIDLDRGVMPSEESIQASVLRCLQLAETLGVRRIAFPALGTGAGTFPFLAAVDVMFQNIVRYLTRKTCVDLVIITLSARKPVTEDDLNPFYDRITTLTRQASSEVASTAGAVSAPDNCTKISRELRAKVLHTKLSGLLSELNILTSHQNGLRIKKAKLASLSTQMDIALHKALLQITEIEAQISEVQKQIEALS